MEINVEEDAKPFKFRPKRDIDGSGNTNKIRAERAMKGMLAYATAGGYSSVDNPCLLQDLLCDLAHMADQKQLDMASALEMGIRCYMEER